MPLSDFVCLTGANNTGKSSVLQALSLFLSPTKLESHHYFDSSKEITIAVMFTEISEADLARFNEEPRERLRALMHDNALELTRRFTFEGETELGYYAQLPKAKNYSKEVVEASFKGKNTKVEVRATIAMLFPDKADQIPADITSQKGAKALIEKWGSELPEGEKELRFKPIPTGADFSINPLFPDDIYIPAVKDLKDDVSVKQGSSFGKVLGILMGKIEAKLSEEAGLFEKLRGKLTRVQKEGVVEDARLEEIKEIESTIQSFVRETFASVDLELDIPPPELRTVLSTARIFINDGTKGPIDFKGDGLRRAVVFSILRTYVALVARKAPPDLVPIAGQVKPSDRGYILMFEEPELFLHPDAQRVLFDALRVFSNDHHVVVTTHSPLFLSPGTATFVRLGKEKSADCPKPFAVATPVNLTDLEPKDEFQLICFENNNAAFFAKKVVLVEGDSDVIAFPHIAVTLNGNWSCSKNSIVFVQVKGKGSIRRYRKFFGRFGLPAYVIADLDVLIRDFDKVDPSPEQQAMRTTLIAAVDQSIPDEPPDPNGKMLKDAQGKGSLKVLWSKAKEAKVTFDADNTKFPALDAAIREFFDWERKESRLTALQNPPNAEIAGRLLELLASLRSDGVFVLIKGAIEDYYPAGVVTGPDKPSKAQCYRNTVTTRDQVLANCPTIPAGAGGAPVHELDLICSTIFR